MINQKFTLSDGIKCFHDDIAEKHLDYNFNGLKQLYFQEEKHFWFISRKQFIFKNISKIIKKDSKIIEVGAGTGNVSRYLKCCGFKNISVGEMHIGGLKYAKEYGINDCYQFDILRNPFSDEFNAVCLFDVLEHIEGDDSALLNVNEMLKKNGMVVLTVPAHQWLWSRDDSIAGHKRRYNKRILCHKLESNGFEIISARYFFMSIVPLLFLRVHIHKETNKKISDEEIQQEININPIVNKILLFITKIENKLNKILPNFFGGSLLVIAKKIR